MKVTFFRLCRKPQTGAGRRYYRLVSYPQDCGEFETLEQAREYALARKYQAILAPGGAWIALTDKARQCLDWHQAGKDGYVNVL